MAARQFGPKPVVPECSLNAGVKFTFPDPNGTCAGVPFAASAEVVSSIKKVLLPFKIARLLP